MKIPFEEFKTLLKEQYRDAMCEQYVEAFDKAETQDDIIAIANSDIHWCYLNNILQYFDNGEIERDYFLEGDHKTDNDFAYVYGDANVVAGGGCRVYMYGTGTVTLNDSASCIVRNQEARIIANGYNAVMTRFRGNVVPNDKTKIV